MGARIEPNINANEMLRAAREFLAPSNRVRPTHHAGKISLNNVELLTIKQHKALMKVRDRVEPLVMDIENALTQINEVSMEEGDHFRCDYINCKILCDTPGEFKMDAQLIFTIKD